MLTRAVLSPIGRNRVGIIGVQNIRSWRPELGSFIGKDFSSTQRNKQANRKGKTSHMNLEDFYVISSHSYRTSGSIINIHQSCRSFTTSRLFQSKEPWMISDGEVNAMISRLETCGKIENGILDRYETNQLPSNQPVEDRKFVAKLLHQDGGYLFGVLDGHGGNACAHSVCQRLPDYMALTLLPRHVLLDHPDLLPVLTEYLVNTSDKECYHNYMDDSACQESLNKYFYELQEMNEGNMNAPVRNVTSHSCPQFLEAQGMHATFAEREDEQVSNTMSGMSNAFLRLDKDISCEALATYSNVEDDDSSKHAFAAANAGACALVAYIHGTELYLANSGDCRAVLGIESEDGAWSAVQLSADHTAGNPEEVQRILSQHPPDEATSVFHDKRLLGRLAPLRAFGDARFKWDKETQERVYDKMTLNPMSEAEHFHTPPYLTAEPEVMSYQLQRSDRFLILATDGLWDMLSNEDVVHYVKEHLYKEEEGTMEVESRIISFDDQEIPCDLSNAASCLVRGALGGDDHVAVSTTLSIPYPDVRSYRDDITVIVVFFDWDKLEPPDENMSVVTSS